MPSLEQIRKLLRAEPDDPFLLYALAQEHARLHDWPSAVDAYRRCLRADPDYCYAYYHLALALHASNDLPAAKAALTAGLDAARRANDDHAASEIHALLASLD